MSGVKEVDVNESIGSVTIHYDPQSPCRLRAAPGQRECSAGRGVGQCGTQTVEDLEDLDEMIEHEAEFLAEHSHSRQGHLRLDQRRSTGASSAPTNNAVDFKVIAPLALAVGAFMELGVTRVDAGLADAGTVLVQPLRRSALSPGTSGRRRAQPEPSSLRDAPARLASKSRSGIRKATSCSSKSGTLSPAGCACTFPSCSGPRQAPEQILERLAAPGSHPQDSQQSRLRLGGDRIRSRRSRSHCRPGPNLAAAIGGTRSRDARRGDDRAWNVVA